MPAPSPHITVNNKAFKLSISQTQLAEAVAQAAAILSASLTGKNPLFLGILNGSFMYMADLVRQLTTPCQVDFVKLSSYSATASTGTVTPILGLTHSLQHRHVVVVEDIIDSGLTLQHLHSTLSAMQPASLQYTALLHKPAALKHPLPPHTHICFNIPPAFVIGYGLDFDGYGRNLPHIYTAE